MQRLLWLVVRAAARSKPAEAAKFAARAQANLDEKRAGMEKVE